MNIPDVDDHIALTSSLVAENAQLRQSVPIVYKKREHKPPLSRNLNVRSNHPNSLLALS